MYNSVDVETAFFDKNEQDKLVKENEKMHFQSNFAFLNSHNGLRRGKMHLFIAPTGVGKSTFVRSLVRDIVFKNKDAKVFLWVTEESKEDVKSQLAYCMPSSKQLENIVIFSELNNRSMTCDNVKEFIEHISANMGFDVLICDNITTSKCYREKKLSDQSSMIDWFKNICGKFNHAQFLIAHTGSEVRENQTRLIDENDVRGSKYISNTVEFLYILQPVWVNQNIHQFLKVKKHRGQDLLHSLYYLVYNKEMKSFTKDVSKNYQDFVDIFKMRNKL